MFSSVFSSPWCLGMAASCDCGSPWTFLLPFFRKYVYGLALAKTLDMSESENSHLEMTDRFMIPPIKLDTSLVLRYP